MRELEQEIETLRNTWASPEVHQKLNDMYTEASEAKEVYEVSSGGSGRKSFDLKCKLSL